MSKRKNLTTRKVDYVAYDESYCHRLAPRLKQLCFFSRSKQFDLRTMKNKVYQIVQGSTVTDKFGWFINEVANTPSKIKLYFLCKNSVNKALNTVVERPVKEQ